MNADLRAEVETITDARVQMYMTVLANKTLPLMVEVAIRAHNNDIGAHGGVQLKTAQARWAVRGFAACLLLMGGAGIERVFGVLF